MHRIWMTIAVVGLALGCTRKLEIKLDDMHDQQQALQSRLDMLERKLHALAQKEEATSPEIELTRKVPAVISEAETPIAPSDDLAEKMANRIMAMLKQTVEATVDARIASQVGSPDDIEAIMSEVVVDEIAAREEADKQEREQQRRTQAVEWDARSLDRRTSAAGLDDESRTAVSAARLAMNEALRAKLPELKAQNASMEDMLAVVAETRKQYKLQLADIMSPEELEAFQDADWWSRRQQRHIDQLATTVSLDDQQKTLVSDAYSDMRLKIGDGFVLMREGYINGNSARQGGEILYQAFNDNIRQILTPDQFQTYESSPDLRFGRGFRRGRGW